MSKAHLFTVLEEKIKCFGIQRGQRFITQAVLGWLWYHLSLSIAHPLEDKFARYIFTPFLSECVRLSGSLTLPHNLLFQ